jgi:hypothetical protein
MNPMTLETPSPTDKKRRKSRFKRRAEPKGMILQDRDIDVLEAIWRGGRLSQKQIELMFFGSYNACYRRMDALFDNQFVERYFINAALGETSPTFYGILRKGVDLLRERKGHAIRWYNSSKDVSDAYLRHAQIINNVWATVAAACRHLNFQLEHWHTEREVKADYDRVRIITTHGERREVAVVPDSVFSVIAYEMRFWFALEADRGTEVGETWKNKVRGYTAWIDSGKFERRYKDTRIRVITVVRTRYSGAKRLHNLKSATEAVGGAKRFWFAPFESIDLTRPESIFEDFIWQVASETEAARLLKPPQSKVSS